MSVIINDAIVAKSDQMNSDDLMGGPITITVRDVTAKDDQKQPQPISIFYDGDNNKPWKPCKSMIRVITALWTREAKNWKGRKITLYRDEKVIFGGDAVGGIRISHMSDIDRSVSMPLTASRGSKKQFTVQPLVEKAASKPAAASTEPNPLRDIANTIREKIKNAPTKTDVDFVLGHHKTDLEKIKAASATAHEAIINIATKQVAQIENPICSACNGDEVVDDGLGGNMPCPSCQATATTTPAPPDNTIMSAG